MERGCRAKNFSPVGGSARTELSHDAPQGERSFAPTRSQPTYETDPHRRTGVPNKKPERLCANLVGSFHTYAILRPRSWAVAGTFQTPGVANTFSTLGRRESLHPSPAKEHHTKCNRMLRVRLPFTPWQITNGHVEAGHLCSGGFSLWPLLRCR